MCNKHYSLHLLKKNTLLYTNKLVLDWLPFGASLFCSVLFFFYSSLSLILMSINRLQSCKQLCHGLLSRYFSFHFHILIYKLFRFHTNSPPNKKFQLGMEKGTKRDSRSEKTNITMPIILKGVMPRITFFTTFFS